jgi:flagellar hook-length control protein FliK
VVGRTSDVAASAQVQSAQQKPARSQASKDTSNDSFGSLVDSNTQAISDSASSPDTAPRRTDSSSSSDNSPRDHSATDPSSQSKASDDTDNSAPAKNDTKNDTTADPAKADSKTKDKSETSDAKSADKSDDTKDKKTDGTDGLAAAVNAAATAQVDATPAAVPDPSIVVAAPVVPLDPNAAANQAASTASSPLTIAAAGIAASASTAAQIAGAKTDTATPGDKSAKTAGAKVDAATSATLADAATGTTDATATDAKTNGGLIAAVDQGTPKTSFKAVVTAQGGSDVSNIGQDTGKANAAQTPATAASANAVHPQADKPPIDANAADAKAGTSDRTADATPATATPHAHAGTQAAVPTTDTSAQAASAVQAPLINTTSATTATLTATAANANAIPISGVPIEIAAAARAGKTRFDISLDPLDLGRIDVRINVDRNGQVTSHLTVEKPETLQMLRQDAPQLQRALDDAGLKTGSNGLSFSLRDQNSSGQNSGQNNDNGGNARRLIISDEEAVPTAPVGRSYGRMLGSSSGVDIRV